MIDQYCRCLTTSFTIRRCNSKGTTSNKDTQAVRPRSTSWCHLLSCQTYYINMCSCVVCIYISLHVCCNVRRSCCLLSLRTRQDLTHEHSLVRKEVAALYLH